MSGPSIYFTLPDLSKFKFPPDPLPRIVPPALSEGELKSPIGVDTRLYNAVLDYKVPVTIATSYVTLVILLNAYNTRNNFKPWRISQTRCFKLFVILHNVFLIAYSASTFIAMLRAARRTWPGLNGPADLAGAADSLCKLHGPRGLGDAITYNTTLNIWEAKNELIRIAPNSIPDTTDAGRLWNEGLAFWGWLFYLSKFYEVVDGLVILAKGKRSPLLQTYHHAGIMITMWTGIRYMSPPIWMAVFLNSGIHTLMYTYYLMGTLNIRVPAPLKRTLTVLQIIQFIFGSSYAAAHLFLKYDIPIKTAYKILHPISSIVSAASSTASVVSTSASEMSASPSASLLPFMKRLLLRAAGDEGVAENIRDSQGQIVMPEVRSAIEHVNDKFREETHYRTEYTKIDCINTSGEVFAILINLSYLLPLTFLFMRFFVRAYLSRSSTQNKPRAVVRSAIDSARRVNSKVENTGKRIEKQVNKAVEQADMEKFQQDLAKTKEGIYKAKERIGQRVDNAKASISKAVDDVKSSEKTPSGKSNSDAKQQQQLSTKRSAAENLHELAQKAKASSKSGGGQDNNINHNSNAANSSGGDDEHDEDEGDESNGEGGNAQSNAQDSPAGKKKRRNKKKKKSSSGGAGVSPAAGTYEQV